MSFQSSKTVALSDEESNVLQSSNELIVASCTCGELWILDVESASASFSGRKSTTVNAITCYKMPRLLYKFLFLDHAIGLILLSGNIDPTIQVNITGLEHVSLLNCVSKISRASNENTDFYKVFQW